MKKLRIRLAIVPAVLVAVVFVLGAALTNARNKWQAPAKPADSQAAKQHAATAAKPSPYDAPKKGPQLLRNMNWLVGGVWTAEASALGPGMKQIETRYQVSDSGAFIRFNTHFVQETRTSKVYDGNFYYDDKAQSLAIWYMAANSHITEGPVTIDGDVMTINFHDEDFAGKMADLRVLVTRKTNDDYRWSVSEKDGNRWKELATLEYLRVAGQ